MSQKMVKIADDLRARFALMETVPGSGYCDNDKNPTKNDLFVAQQKQKVEGSDKLFCKCSENLVPFYGEWDIVLVGDDCIKARSVLQEWAIETAKLPPDQITPKQHKMIRCISKLATTVVDNTERLTFRRALWNDYAQIFYWMGQGLSGQPFTEEE